MGEIEKLLLLSAVPVKTPEKIKEQYSLAPEQKELYHIEKCAHAQHIFKTEHAAQLEEKIISF